MPTLNALAPVYADEADGEDDLYLPRNRPKRDTRSKLVRSKEAAAGMVVNACPFGCEEHQLDEQTYCDHLVGFTDPNDDRLYFPMIWRDTKDSRGRPTKRYRYVDGENPAMVQKGDLLVRITTCSRVYREVPEPVAAAPLIPPVPPTDAELELLTAPNSSAQATI